MNKISHRIIDLLYHILIFLIVFEELLKNLIINTSPIKYLVIFLLVLIVLYYKGTVIQKREIDKLLVLYYCILVFSALFSLYFFVQVDWNGAKILKQYWFFPVLCFIFQRYESFAANKYSRLIKWYIVCVILFSLINPLLFFSKINIWESTYRPYWGRISVGYPTVDVVNYSFVLTLLLFSSKEYFKKTSSIYFSMLLTLGIAIQASGTGIVLVGVIYAFAIHSLGCSSILGKRKIKVYLLFTILLISMFIGWLQTTKQELFGFMFQQIQNRILVLVNKSEMSQLNKVNTLETRELQFKRATERYQEAFIHRLLGAGFGRLNYDLNNNKKDRVFLEDQMHFSLFTVGYIGFVVGNLFYFYFSYRIYRRFWKKDKNRFYTYYLIILIMFIAQFTSIPLVTFTTVGSFSLLLVMMKKSINSESRELFPGWS